MRIFNDGKVIFEAMDPFYVPAAGVFVVLCCLGVMFILAGASWIVQAANVSHRE